MTSSSAPGKIILFGEHAVVYGRPALAVPVTQVKATATATSSSRPGIWIEAPDINLRSELSRLPVDHPLGAVIRLVLSAQPSPQAPLPRKGEGCIIRITSTIPVASGLGSGAAVSVAIIRALSEFLGQPMPDDRVSALAFEVEKLHHGTPSGIDNSVVTYARPVYFIKGHPIETFHVGAPFTIVIGDTGIPAPTKESVGHVCKLWEADKRKWEKIFDRVGEIVINSREIIINGNWEELGPLMDANHSLLQTLGVSCPELDRLVDAGRRSGALGAKMSGGGRGGNMIALIHTGKIEEVTTSLRSAGAQRIVVTTVQ